jgi:hydrogenase nickel incorporation protein HypB
MCATCGCQGGKTTMLDLQTGETTTIGTPHPGAAPRSHAHGDMHFHDHAEQHDHDHAEPHEHEHHHHGPHGDSAQSHEHSHVNVLNVETRILAKNDALAAKNRAWFAGREILALNVVSSPGAGKTSLLERSIRDLGGQSPLYVIEGDQATANDGERIRKAGAAVVQINTGTGCHLDAAMVTRALVSLKPWPGSIVLIENVGNLVCPALFDLGERAKVVIFPVTDGEDKPLKYPHIFRAAAVVILNKTDLLPHLGFSRAEAIANVRRVNPAALILEVSARTGEGMADWYHWLHEQLAAARQSAFAGMAEGADALPEDAHL